jgi:hypothetical protein
MKSLLPYCYAARALGCRLAVRAAHPALRVAAGAAGRRTAGPGTGDAATAGPGAIAGPGGAAQGNRGE